jgi:ubiquinone/menaquinone biosynthesis C-methylase UbiE
MGIEQQVASHYARPDLERAILDALAAAGQDPDRLNAVDLAPVDEFHLGWLPMTVELGRALGLADGMRLLDLGSGIGGPARYFAQAHGCRVTGIDLTEDYVRIAETLTERCGLVDRVTFRQASALELPFEPASFDAATLMHVGMNIADKAALFAQARRVLRPGGLLAVYEVMRTADGEIRYPTPWAASAETSFVEPPSAYRRLLATAGFVIESERDRRDLVLQQAAEMRARMAREGPPALGLHLVVGPAWRDWVRNLMAALEAGTVAPIEIMARAA